MSTTDLTPQTRSLPPQKPLPGGKVPKALTIEQRARLIYPHWPTVLINKLVRHWIDTGDIEQALSLVRQDKTYDQFFPGNKRSDGTIRLGEADYFSTVQGYRNVLRGYGLDPSEFEARGLFGKAIAGELSVNEVGRRTSAVYKTLEADIPQLRAWYSQNYGIRMTDQAVFAAALDSSIGEDLLNRRLSAAQIGGLAASFGFSRDRRTAERLAGMGVDRNAAQQLYGRAQSELPTLNALSGRWDQYDPTVEINEFENALVGGSMATQRRFEGLVRAEQTSFSPTSSFREDREGGLIGLRER